MNALELAAQRQAVWSTTANALKAILDRTRWATFALSILGALLATIAAQTEGSARWWFAMGAAVVLATATFLTSRLLGGSHVTDWVRARAAAEALKREAYKCAAQSTPYDSPARMTTLNSERQKIEDGVLDLIEKEVAPTRPGSTPAKDISPSEYVEQRVDKQIHDFYERKAEMYRRVASGLGWAEFILALAATIITAIVGAIDKQNLPGHFDFVALAAVLTTISGAIVAHVEASRYAFLVATYRATARRLSNELADVTGTFVTPSPDWSDFVNRCEAIIADENGGWLAKWTK